MALQQEGAGADPDLRPVVGGPPFEGYGAEQMCGQDAALDRIRKLEWIAMVEMKGDRAVIDRHHIGDVLLAGAARPGNVRGGLGEPGKANV